MNKPAYVFRAELWCAPCAERVHAMETPPAGMVPGKEHTWDSDEWPKGPYPDGGGEADTPQHCDRCGDFLENPLTDAGRVHARTAVLDYLNGSGGNPATLLEWTCFYGITVEELITA